MRVRVRCGGDTACACEAALGRVSKKPRTVVASPGGLGFGFGLGVVASPGGLGLGLGLGVVASPGGFGFG